MVLWLSSLSVQISSQRSTFSGEFLNVKYLKKVEKGFLDTATDYKWDASASEADTRHDFWLSATIYSLECLESEGENPAIFIVQEVVWGLRKESIEHETAIFDHLWVFEIVSGLNSVERIANIEETEEVEEFQKGEKRGQWLL